MRHAMREGVTKLTYEHYLLFPDDGRRHELIDGEHVVTPAPRARHQVISQNLNVALTSFVRAHGLGRVLYAPVDVVLTDLDVVQPDLIFLSSASCQRLGDVLEGPPDLAIEIASPGTRRVDEVLKLALYERSGVLEYWLVDPEAEAVKVYRREGASFGGPELLTLRREDVLRTPLLGGLEIPLAEVFAA